MKLAEAYQTFYHIRLQLGKDGMIHVSGISKLQIDRRKGVLEWLRTNKAHAIKRLREEE